MAKSTVDLKSLTVLFNDCRVSLLNRYSNLREVLRKKSILVLPLSYLRHFSSSSCNLLVASHVCELMRSICSTKGSLSLAACRVLAPSVGAAVPELGCPSLAKQS